MASCCPLRMGLWDPLPDWLMYFLGACLKHPPSKLSVQGPRADPCQVWSHSFFSFAKWCADSRRRRRRTLPTTNIAPESRPSQKETHCLPTIHFQGLCLVSVRVHGNCRLTMVFFFGGWPLYTLARIRGFRKYLYLYDTWYIPEKSTIHV